MSTSTDSDTMDRLTAELARLSALDLPAPVTAEIRDAVTRGLYFRAVPTGDFELTFVPEICLDTLDRLAEIPRE